MSSAPAPPSQRRRRRERSGLFAPTPSQRRRGREGNTSSAPPLTSLRAGVAVGRGERGERVGHDGDAFRVIATARTPPLDAGVNST